MSSGYVAPADRGPVLATTGRLTAASALACHCHLLEALSVPDLGTIDTIISFTILTVNGEDEAQDERRCVRNVFVATLVARLRDQAQAARYRSPLSPARNGERVAEKMTFWRNSGMKRRINEG